MLRLHTFVFDETRKADLYSKIARNHEDVNFSSSTKLREVQNKLKHMILRAIHPTRGIAAVRKKGRGRKGWEKSGKGELSSLDAAAERADPIPCGSVQASALRGKVLWEIACVIIE